MLTLHSIFFPEILREYEKLPSKRTNAGYTTVKNSVSVSAIFSSVLIITIYKTLNLIIKVNCLICGPNTKRKFANITEYKQHLAIFHFRNQVSFSVLLSMRKGFKLGSGFSDFGNLLKQFCNRFGRIDLCSL